MLNKSLVKQLEFIVEGPKVDKIPGQIPVPFTISPASLENVREQSLVPDFKIR